MDRGLSHLNVEGVAPAVSAFILTACQFVRWPLSAWLYIKNFEAFGPRRKSITVALRRRDTRDIHTEHSGILNHASSEWILLGFCLKAASEQDLQEYVRVNMCVWNVCILRPKLGSWMLEGCLRLLEDGKMRETVDARERSE